MTHTWQRNFGAIAALAGVAVLSGKAGAQCTPTATTSGPDVVVGDMTGPSNYSSASGLEALSIGTYSCNIGNTWLNWIDSTNDHPVIGSTLYRYKLVGGAGRFEQVGLSWLKHGFYALSDNLCCTGCSATDGTHLGVHCSDPYTSGRNGTQAGLGPRYQVNAHTGVFTYPPANPAYSGTTARRLQVDINDLEVTGGTTRYFGESQYVTKDDAAAGNQNNNASYREVTVSGSGTAWNFGFTGSTQRGQYALHAWKVAEPAVTLTEIQLPGDGLVIVGYRTTNLGGGMYHYEYAVQNLNADTGIGSFSIPLSTSAHLSNIGFHDVTYRNGDGVGNVSRDGTDWAVTQTASAITWACPTYASNTNGNGLLWSTCFNFRFDADVPPASANATLTTWRTVSNVFTSVDTPGGTPPPPPPFAYCFGDGSGTACPCGNNSTVGNNEGCLNSLGVGGRLQISGTPSISADTLVLAGDNMPDSSALYFQGTSQILSGAGAMFGDGLRCAGGSIVRLATKTNFLGGSQFPAGGDPAVSVRGAVSSGQTSTYQIWYRNAAAFCTASTYNLTNGYQLVWSP